MQFLICEGCDLRERPCIAADQSDDGGYPGTCIYDIDGTNKKNWNKVNATDIGMWLFYEGLEAVLRTKLKAEKKEDQQ